MDITYLSRRYIVTVCSPAEIFACLDFATGHGRRELEALTSIREYEQLASLSMELVGYRELSEKVTSLSFVQEKL